MLGGHAAEVNSFHHQAVDRLGDGLRALGVGSRTARSRAIEDPRHPFLLGVQWHAETLIDLTRQLALFAALVEAAVWRSRVLARAA